MDEKNLQIGISKLKVNSPSIKFNNLISESETKNRLIKTNHKLHLNNNNNNQSFSKKNGFTGNTISVNNPQQYNELSNNSNINKIIINKNLKNLKLSADNTNYINNKNIFSNIKINIHSKNNLDKNDNHNISNNPQNNLQMQVNMFEQNKNTDILKKFNSITNSKTGNMDFADDHNTNNKVVSAQNKNSKKKILILKK